MADALAPAIQTDKASLSLSFLFYFSHPTERVALA